LVSNAFHRPWILWGIRRQIWRVPSVSRFFGRKNKGAWGRVSNTTAVPSLIS
jgi:hypothetical protein